MVSAADEAGFGSAGVMAIEAWVFVARSFRGLVDAG